MTLKRAIGLFVMGVCSMQLAAQCPGITNGAANCDPNASQLIIANSPNIEFNFDSFGKISGGMEMDGSSVIKVIASNNAGLTCKWNLIMYVSNDGGTTPPAEWSTLTNYGSGSTSTNPELNLIEIRVTNFCGTPINNGVWQSFAALSGSSINIIHDVFNANLSGLCNGTQTNTEGSYLNNYGEYSFTVDYRIKPGFTHEPGRYVMKIMYCLSEM